MKKLVRNKIPSLMEAEGLKPNIKFVKDKELKQFLIKKLEEEKEELFSALNGNGSVIEEIADCMEILEFIGLHQEIKMSEILTYKECKNEFKGTFSEGIVVEFETTEKVQGENL